MSIPEIITIGSITIPIYVPVLLLDLLLSAYILWAEARKDGFDEEKIYDLCLVSLIAIIFFGKVFSLSAFIRNIDVFFIGFSYLGSLFGYIFSVFILTKKWKWSVFRVLDIQALSLSLFLGVFCLFNAALFKDPVLLPPAIVWLGYSIIFQRLRGNRFRSGNAFALFCFISSVVGYLFVKDLHNLIFVISSNTIGLVVYLYRGKKQMAKNTGLTLDFVNSIKNRLNAKNKKLKSGQKLLIEEDPYMQKDRDTDNADTFDDAILEDHKKEVTDLQTNVLTNAQLSVRRALARLRIGKYGICEVCGKQIDKARLQAFPEATTCIEHMK